MCRAFWRASATVQSYQPTRLTYTCFFSISSTYSAENHWHKAEFRTSFSIATGRFASWDWPRASKDTMQSQSQQGCGVLRETGTWSTRGDLCMGVGIQTTKIHIQNQNSFRIQSDTACRLWHLLVSGYINPHCFIQFLTETGQFAFSTEAFIRLHWW